MWQEDVLAITGALAPFAVPITQQFRQILQVGTHSEPRVGHGPISVGGNCHRSAVTVRLTTPCPFRGVRGLDELRLEPLSAWVFRNAQA